MFRFICMVKRYVGYYFYKKYGVDVLKYIIDGNVFSNE
jgi:hypothetical protein